MNKKLATALLASTFSSILLVSVPNSAYAASPSCTLPEMCTWTGKNYTGHKYSSGLLKNLCYLNNRVRSTKHNTNIEVRYYPDKNCASKKYYDSSWDFINLDGETGWAVYSYKRIS
ncbi:peptidase inhibitor family I36 protein [Streptomyces cellostaticus]|uniref:peptidase inhibitor family I36 protein n=1 Tax=Streptomyces cellostaticus TaxID=67285 RepID=UPI00099EBEDD|nr:peptidase inhibitor family I36 protein [Streptomyces cellostaticus]GHI06371.1 hypothetical protein Scel_46920 [Streptomyces cellostaticus]